MGERVMGKIRIEGFDELKNLLEYTCETIKRIAKDMVEELLKPEQAEKEAVYIATYYKTLRQQGLNPHLAGKLTLLRQMNLKLLFKELAEFPGEEKQEKPRAAAELWEKIWKEKLNPENIGTTD